MIGLVEHGSSAVAGREAVLVGLAVWLVDVFLVGQARGCFKTLAQAVYVEMCVQMILLIISPQSDGGFCPIKRQPWKHAIQTAAWTYCSVVSGQIESLDGNRKQLSTI